MDAQPNTATISHHSGAPFRRRRKLVLASELHQDQTPVLVGAYIRVSTHREATISPELQLRDLQGWAERMTATTGRRHVIVKVVEDLDISGRTFARAGIQELMQVVRDSVITTIRPTYRFDRFGRNLRQTLQHLYEAEQFGGQVVSVTELFDATTAIGDWQRSQSLAQADLFSKQIGEGWKRVHHHRVEKGLPTNGRERFGYLAHRTTQLRSDGALRVCPQGCPAGECATGFVPDPETGPVLRYLYEAYIDGRGFQAIAHEMNAQRQPTPGMEWAARSGKHERIARFAAAKWSTNTVIDLVDTGFAAGLITHNGVWRPGTHESLITNDQWGTYRRRRDSQRQMPTKARSPRWSLAGLARCGVCGGRIYCSRTNRGEGYALYCGAYCVSGTCSGVHRTRAPVEAAVALWLQQYAKQLEAAANEALRTAKNAPRSDPLASERQRLRRVISSGQARAERLLDAYTDGALDLATYKTRRDDEKSQVTDAQDLLIRLSTPAPTPLTASCAINFARTWPGLSVDARRDVSSRLLKEVRIHSDKSVELFPWSRDPVTVTFTKRDTLPRACLDRLPKHGHSPRVSSEQSAQNRALRRSGSVMHKQHRSWRTHAPRRRRRCHPDSINRPRKRSC